MNLNTYLKKLFEHDEIDEAIFPMDSVHTGKPLEILHDEDEEDFESED